MTTRRSLVIGLLLLILAATARSTHQVQVAPAPQLELATSFEMQLQHVPNEYTAEGSVNQQPLEDLSRHVRSELLQRGYAVNLGFPSV